MKNVFRKIFRVLRRSCEIYEMLFYWLLRRKSQRGSSRIVVIQNSHLGDFVLSIPFFTRLKEFCNGDLVLVSDSRIEEVARSSGLFAEFVGLDMKRASGYRHLLYRVKVLWQLRAITAGKVVQCFGVGATNFEDCMALSIRADERYAFVGSRYNVQRSGWLYDALKCNVYSHTLPYRMELSLVANENNYANFIVGNEKPVCIGNLAMFEPLPERDACLGDYCLIIPGADDPRRRWEAEKFACLARQVVAIHHNLISFSSALLRSRK